MGTMVFKIRRRDGMFSKGGSRPSFSANGKIWKRQGDLTSHLTLIGDYGERSYYEGCEIVQYRLVETEIAVKPISEYIAERDEKRRQYELERQLRYDALRKDDRHQEYLRLKKEFE